MPLTEEEITQIELLVESVNHEINNIVSARDDVLALLRIYGSINNDTIEDAILIDARNRAKTAAQELVSLL